MNFKNNRTRTFAFLVLMFLMLNIVQIIYLQSRIREIGTEISVSETTAMATGITTFCLNQPPSDIINNCNFIIPWGYPYYCNNITTADPDFEPPYVYSSLFLTNNTLFNMTLDAEINFTPPKFSIGNHTVRIYVSDNSGCINSLFFKDFNISIVKANHPPYLAQNISNASFNKTTSFVFVMNDYFKDPDDDNLTYIYGVSSNNITSITIDNASHVTITGLNCGVNHVFYVATDPYNLTAVSNTATYTITGCPSGTLSPPGQGSGSGGGGGGPMEECVPQWRCGPWSDCHIDNTSEMICQDYAVCDPHNYIQHQKRNCTYVPPVFICQEKWNCTDWSPCVNNTHTRTCLDTNSCGTNTSKPLEMDNCTFIASCFNGIQDPNELGIDCGGPCAPCKNLEAPAVVNPSFNPAILIAIIMTLIMIGLVGYTFRAQIIKLLLPILRKARRKKHIYLKEKQKNKLLEIVFVAQARFEEKNYEQALANISAFIFAYFKELLNIEHPTKEAVAKAIIILKNRELEGVILNFYHNLMHYESAVHKPYKVNVLQMQAIIDEIMSNIYLVSEFTEKDAIISVKERAIQTKSALEECYLKLSNLYITLEFSELQEAKNIYLDILKKYESLMPHDKHVIYHDLIRAYNIINYIEHEGYLS